MKSFKDGEECGEALVRKYWGWFRLLVNPMTTAEELRREVIVDLDLDGVRRTRREWSRLVETVLIHRRCLTAPCTREALV